MIWKLLHWASWILLVPFVGLFWWSLTPKKAAPARSVTPDAGRLRFPAYSVQLWMWILGGVEMLIIAAGYFRHGFHATWECFTGALFCLSGVGWLTGIQTSVAMSDTGIEEVHWLGRNKFIRWDEIEEINIGKRDRIITIRSKEKTKIVYSMRPENRIQFLDEIKRHCGDELPPEFPGELPKESASG
ncbi:MAG: hypothetical protein WBD67_00815 [Terracidiphilus sp.]